MEHGDDRFQGCSIPGLASGLASGTIDVRLTFNVSRASKIDCNIHEKNSTIKLYKRDLYDGGYPI
jgi:hypothetical protein